MYGYISEKARIFLKMKPEIYRKNDALGMPDPDLTEDEINLITEGCRQILEGKGEKQVNPLTGIGIHGFYLLIELFHFNVEMQSIIQATKDGYLDKMDCVHLVTGCKLVLYNYISRINKTECR
jgi:hypothetical protein